MPKFSAVVDLMPFSTIAVVGKRGTGKSVLLRDLLYRFWCTGKVDAVLAMTPTMETMRAFKTMIPECFLYTEFAQMALAGVLEVQREACHNGITPQHVLIVLDDMMYDKSILKGKEMREVFMNGRHLNITFIISMQYLMDMGPDLRSNVDYVFALRESSHANRTKLWKYWFGMFSVFAEFVRTFEACTAGYSCAVLINNGKCGDGVGAVRWYIASAELPEFKLARARYWLMQAAAGMESTGAAAAGAGAGGAATRPMGAINIVECTGQVDE